MAGRRQTDLGGGQAQCLVLLRSGALWFVSRLLDSLELTPPFRRLVRLARLHVELHQPLQGLGLVPSVEGCERAVGEEILPSTCGSEAWHNARVAFHEQWFGFGVLLLAEQTGAKQNLRLDGNSLRERGTLGVDRQALTQGLFGFGVLLLPDQLVSAHRKPGGNAGERAVRIRRVIGQKFIDQLGRVRVFILQLVSAGQHHLAAAGFRSLVAHKAAESVARFNQQRLCPRSIVLEGVCAGKIAHRLERYVIAIPEKPTGQIQGPGTERLRLIEFALPAEGASQPEHRVYGLLVFFPELAGPDLQTLSEQAHTLRTGSAPAEKSHR